MDEPRGLAAFALHGTTGAVWIDGAEVAALSFHSPGLTSVWLKGHTSPFVVSGTVEDVGASLGLSAQGRKR